MEHATWSGKRGDIHALGIEHKQEPDGSWSQETRITSVLLGAAISSRYPWIAWSGHSTWDPWTREDDPGPRLWLPDWQADVLDILGGRQPWRTVGAAYIGSGPTPES